MIEQLYNCPNCGAILDDTGRCNFCGSKIYDLFDIDVNNNRSNKYIRIKTDRGLIIAPVAFNRVSIENSMAYYDILTITTEFLIIGSVIYEERSDKE